MSLNIDRIPACLRLETTTIRGTREKERILYKLTKTRKGCIDNRRSSLIKRIITLLVIAEIGKLWGTIEKPVTLILLLYQPFGIRNIARYFRYLYTHTSILVSFRFSTTVNIPSGKPRRLSFPIIGVLASAADVDCVTLRSYRV